ncbi:MAG: class I SAM-dependent methyltransferase [Clostridia bacterium]|nr:class I SAM-dependent methyltransferase [Clostridia bacterium]
MIPEKHVNLDPRLSLLADMVGRTNSVMDVGCDHGRLGAYLLQKGWVERAVMTDISDDSLSKARALFRLIGCDDKASFVVCDGVPRLDTPCDTIVIAGMGGTTIADIVEAGKNLIGQSRLLMAPNVAQPELRRRLSENGFSITDERVVQDGRRHYVLIEAKQGTAEYDETDLFVGPILRKTLPRELTGYADFRIRVLKKALNGAEGASDESAVAELKNELKIWEDVRKCL